MEKTKSAATAPTEKKPAATKTEPRSFLATLLFAVSFGQLGANRLYTGDTTLGWIRFGLFGGGVLLSPFIIGLPLMLAAQIWGWVDVFLVYHGNRTDADGIPLTLTARDRKVAKLIYILFVVGLAVAVVSLILLIVLAIVMGMTLDNGSSERFRDYDNHPYFEQTY